MTRMVSDRRRLPPGILFAWAASALVLPATAGTATAEGCRTLVTVVVDEPGATCPGDATTAVLPRMPVLWCYQLANDGTGVLGRAAVTDSLLGSVPGDIGDVAPGAVSAPIAVRAEGAGTHTAKIDARTGGGAAVVCAAGTATVLAAEPAVAIELTASTEGRCPGVADVMNLTEAARVTFCYRVTNADAVTTLYNVAVVDDQAGPDPVVTIASLAPGEAQTVTHSRFVTSDLTSIVTVSGTPIYGRRAFPDVRARDSLSIDRP